MTSQTGCAGHPASAIIRGIERKEIVKDDHDRQNFVYRMGVIALETGTLIYAWTLMTNHAHIFLIHFRLYFDMSHLTPSGVPPVQNCHHRPGEVPHQSLNRTGAPATVNRTLCSRTACFHDAFARMRPDVRFHSSDGITRGEGAPISRRDCAWHIRGCRHVEYVDGDILPALPETMTARERRPLSHTIADLQESWQVT